MLPNQRLDEGFFRTVKKNAKDFIRTKYKSIKKNARALFNDIKRKFTSHKDPNHFRPGKMLSFTYNAKHKENSWDKYPLIICLGPPRNKKLQNTHTYGLNFHHIPMSTRVQIASYFVELLKKRKGKLVYSDVAPFMNKFKNHQVLRLYIIKRISNKVIEMPSDIFLSTASIPSEEIIKGVRKG